MGRNTAELYQGMAVHELHGVSPSYEPLCRAVAGSEPTRALLDTLPRVKRQPNLLLGAVRFLGGPVDDPTSFLNCARSGPVPLPTRLPEVVWRAGFDLNPLQAHRDDRRWLASLVWPEQIDRVERLDQALGLVAADPPRLDAGDLLVDLPGLLADAPSDGTLVVFHSAVLAYLDEEQRSRFTDVMRAVKRTRDVHWVSNEANGVISGADMNPRPHGRFILAHDQVPVAVTGPHGHSLDWLP